MKLTARRGPLSRSAGLLVTVLLVTGCGLTATQKAAVTGFGDAAQTLGALTAEEFVAGRNDVIEMNTLRGELKDPRVADKEPDGNFTLAETEIRVKAAKTLARYGEDRLRTHVLRGGYRLIDAPDDGRPGVTIVTTGVMAPEAIAAANALDDEGVQVSVIHLTSPDRAYTSWRSSYATVSGGGVVRSPSHLHRLVPADERGRPVVSVHDAASHALAWIGSALGCRQIALGVDRFGESGTIKDLHALTGIASANIVNAALLACEAP